MAGVGGSERTGPGDEVRPPRWAAPVTALVLGVMVVAFLTPGPLDLWPATSWELFSRARGAEQVGASVDLVADDGTVAPLPFSRLGPDHQRWRRVAVRLPGETPEQQSRTCASWAEAAQRALGDEAVYEVRVLRVTYRAADRAADPPTVVRRDVVVRCGPP